MWKPMTLSISLKYPEYLKKKTVMHPVSSPKHSTEHEGVKGIGKINHHFQANLFLSAY